MIQILWWIGVLFLGGSGGEIGKKCVTLHFDELNI